MELALQMVIRYHMGARNQTLVLGKKNKCSELLSSLSMPYLCDRVTYLSITDFMVEVQFML